MACDIRALNGNPSHLHGGLYRYYRESGLNNKEATSYATADWVHTQLEDFNKANMVIDPNGEPELYYNEDTLLREVTNEDLHRGLAEDKTPVYVRISKGIKELINAVRAKPSALNYDPTLQITEPQDDAKRFAAHLSERFGVPIDFITTEEAKQLYKEAGKQYKGQPAFSVKGQAYVIEGRASRANLVHEIFGHPLIELLQQEEPHVYNALINEVMNNEGIKSFIQKEYPEEVNANGTFTETGKKEAVLKALEMDVNNTLSDIKASGIKPFIRRFWDAIRRILGISKDVGLNSLSTVGDLTRIVLGDTNIALGNYAPQMLYSTMTGADGADGMTTAERYAEEIRKEGTLNGRITFVTSDLGQEDYKDSKNPDKKISRSSEVVNVDFGRAEPNPDYLERARNRATKVFRNAGKDINDATATVTLSGKTKPYTFKQLTYEYLREGNDARNYGKVGHTYVQGGFDSNPEIIKRRKELSRTKSAPDSSTSVISKGFKDPDKTFDWMLHGGESAPEGQGGAVDDLKRLVGYQDDSMDVVALTEHIIYDEEWGIGGTVDNTFVYPDKEVGTIDSKFGHIEGGENSEIVTTAMKYMDLAVLGPAASSRFNLATMNMVLRSVMQKKKFPDMKWKYMKIASFKKGITPVRLLPDSNLQHYLSAIAKWSEEHHPDTYKKNRDAGLFDADNYWGETLENYKYRTAQEESLKEEDRDTVISAVKTRAEVSNQLVGLHTQLQELRKEPESKKRDDRIRNVSKSISELTTLMLQWTTPRLSAQEITSKYDDLPSLTWIHMNQYDVKIPPLVALKDMRNRAAQEVNERMADLDNVHMKLVEDVKREKGIGGFQTGIGAMPYYKEGGGGVWNFLFVEQLLESDTEGTRIRFISKTRDAEKYAKLRPAEKAYVDYVLPLMEAAYNKSVGNRKILTASGTTTTKAKALGLPEKWNAEDAMVWMDYAPQERAEREANLSATLKRIVKNTIGAFISTDSELHAKRHAGLPVKYMALPENMKVSRSHSLNGEHIFARFMEHMTNVELMEDVYATATGVDILMRYYQIHGKYHYKNALEYLDRYIMGHMEHRKDDATITGGRWADSETGKIRSTNMLKGLETIKGLTTFSTLSLQPVLAGLNATLITGINYKVAFENIIANKLAGVKNIAFGPAEMTRGYADYVQLKKDIATGNHENNKLYHILKEWKWEPDNYDFVTHKKNMGYVKTHLEKEKLLFFHALVENMGNVSILSALLHGMKVKAGGKEMSAYDAYSVKEVTDPASGKKIKKLDWKAGVRGYVKTQVAGVTETTEITKLTSEEISNLMKTSAKITGDYRQSEKGAADMNALWNMVLQFKRYMVRYFKNMLGKPGWDATLGRYIQTGEEEIDMFPGVKVPILRWERVYSEGWTRTMMHGTICALLMTNLPGLRKLAKACGTDADAFIKKYRWENLTDEQKHNVVIGAGNFLFMLMSMAAFFGFKDDDTFMVTRIKRLISDMEQGGSVTDTLSAWDRPAPAVSKLKNLVQYGTQLIVSEVTQDRTREGNLKGYKNFVRQFGPIGAIEQAQKIASGE